MKTFNDWWKSKYPQQMRNKSLYRAVAENAWNAALETLKPQPIETVPHDTFVLILHAGVWKEASFNSTVMTWMTHNSFLSDCFPPTHWLPLPPIPEKSEWQS